VQVDEWAEVDAVQCGLITPGLHSCRHDVDRAPQLLACESKGPFVRDEGAYGRQDLMWQVEEGEGQVLLHVDDDEGKVESWLFAAESMPVRFRTRAKVRTWGHTRMGHTTKALGQLETDFLGLTMYGHNLHKPLSCALC
jgi:hypothetical protein